MPVIRSAVSATTAFATPVAISLVKPKTSAASFRPIPNTPSQVNNGPITLSLASSASVLATILPALLFREPATPAPARPSPVAPSAQSTTLPSMHRLAGPVAEAHQSTKLRLALASTSTDLQLKYLPKIQQRLSFYVSEFLLWNSGAKILSLFAFTVFTMYLGQFLYMLADPKRSEAHSPFWHSVRAIANPLEDDWENNSLRATSILLASFGMIIFAILIGTVTDSVQSAVENADGQNTPIVLQDHLLILGWNNDHTPYLIQNLSTTKNVVVLSSNPADYALVEQENQRLAALNQDKRIFYRPGTLSSQMDLAKVAAWSSNKILLLDDNVERTTDAGSSSSDNSNVTTKGYNLLTKVVSLKQNLQSYNGDIVIQVNNNKTGEIIKNVINENKQLSKNVEIINVQDILNRFIVQVANYPGLNSIVRHLMTSQNENHTFHIRSISEIAPQWVGKTYDQLQPLSIDGYITCGVVDANNANINIGSSLPSKSTINKDTQLLVLGEIDNSNSSSEDLKLPLQTFFKLQQSIAKKDSEQMHNGKLINANKDNFLILGYRNDMNELLSELNTMLPKNSKVTIVSNNIPSNFRNELKPYKLNKIKIRTCGELYDEHDPSSIYETLDNIINKDVYDNILLLFSDSDMNTDTKSLSKLVFIDDIVKNNSKKYSEKNQPIITAEFRDEAISQLVQNEGIGNIVLPDTLGAKIASQAIKHPVLNQVWTELLSQKGREFYLKSINSYSADLKLDTSKMVSFADIVNSISKGAKNDIVIGYIPKHGAGIVRINPVGEQRYTKRLWHPEDVLIVLAKDA